MKPAPIAAMITPTPENSDLASKAICENSRLALCLGRFKIRPMSPIQEQAWEKMLTVQLNTLYWGKKAFWLKLRLQLIQICAAIIGCAAFGTLFIDPAFGLFNKILALIAAILSLVLSVFDLKGTLSQVEETEQLYSTLFGKFEKLWAEISVGLSEEEIKEALAALVDEQSQIKDPNVGISERLKAKSYREICMARGLATNG